MRPHPLLPWLLKSVKQPQTKIKSNFKGTLKQSYESQKYRRIHPRTKR